MFGIDRRRVMVGAAVGLVGALVATTEPAEASRPVARVLHGRVTAGVFTTVDGYVVRPRTGVGGRPVDLGRFEGWCLELRGHLLPGDVLITTAPPRPSSRCDGARGGRTEWGGGDAR